MKELDPAVINAVDLDIPKNNLLFSVVQAPQHGTIMGRTYGNDVPANGRPVNRHRDAEVLVQDFTMQELRNGTAL